MRMLPLLILVSIFAIALVILTEQPARGDQLLVNPGFEDGLNGWQSIDATLELGSQPRLGANSGLLTSETSEQGADLFQWVPVEAGQAYAFSGFVLADHPAIERTFLRISWFAASNDLVTSEDSPWLTGQLNEYRKASITSRTAPVGAVKARLSIQFTTSGPFSANVDDMSFEGPPPDTATPLASPTVPLTDTPTPAPSAPPTGSATVQPSSVTTSTPQPTPSPSPTRTATPTPTRIVPSSTIDEPTVFATLTNGGFEQAGARGAYGWRKIGGTLALVTRPVRGGRSALSISSQDSSSTKWAYQTVRVSEGGFFDASAYVLKNDPGVAAAFLRISWYESEDGSGEAIASTDSTSTLTSNDSDYRLLTTGPVETPAGAKSAKVRLTLRPAGEGPATVHFDDVTFMSVAAPTETPSAKPTRTPEPTTPTPAESSTAAATTAPGTPNPTPRSTTTPVPSTPTRTAEPLPTPEEPRSFTALTNGGFEIARDDGSPYAWRKIGGQMAVTGDGPAGGTLALEIVSTSASTKWVHQAVNVEPGKYYEATGWSRANGGDSDTFLRLSWYSSEDGEGQALSSVDSAGTVSGGDSGFAYLTTGPARAPEDARSVRVRLMFRPGSDARLLAVFDEVALGEVTAPALVDATTTPRPTALSAATQPRPTRTGPTPDVAGTVEEVRPGQIRTAIMPTNVRPALTVDETPRPSEGDDVVSLRDILLAIGIGVPLAGIGGLFAFGKKEGSQSDRA